MRTKKTDVETDELRPEYDPTVLGSGVRGKYAARFREGTNLVLLEPDVAEVFPDAEAVNSALRVLITAAKKQLPKQRSRKRS